MKYGVGTVFDNQATGGWYVVVGHEGDANSNTSQYVITAWGAEDILYSDSCYRAASVEAWAEDSKFGDDIEVHEPDEAEEVVPDHVELP